MVRTHTAHFRRQFLESSLKLHCVNSMPLPRQRPIHWAHKTLAAAPGGSRLRALCLLSSCRPFEMDVAAAHATDASHLDVREDTHPPLVCTTATLKTVDLPVASARDTRLKHHSSQVASARDTRLEHHSLCVSFVSGEPYFSTTFVRGQICPPPVGRLLPTVTSASPMTGLGQAATRSRTGACRTLRTGMRRCVCLSATIC
jgi:hypothetical protein